jgi:hypothetical protein
MSDQPPPDDFAKFVNALDEYGERFDIRDASEPRRLGVSVSQVRRRRGRLADDRETGYRDVVLVERDGVLLWQTAADLAGTRGGGGLRRSGRRGWRRGLEGARVLKEVTVPVLEPNEYLAALRDTDLHLNKDCDTGLRVVAPSSGRSIFQATTVGLKPSYAGRTLVIVHGTFSSATNVLSELGATESGAQFLSDALKQYKGQVLVFDHPTLSVSPFLNALDLARRLAGITGQLDIIAHSRGGLVTQWWLEVFGETLAGANVRAILAGAPLRGTSLAAPNRIQPLLSVLSNVGHFVERTLKVAAAANPFTLASFALLKFLGRRERNRWGLPPIDGIGSRPGTDAAVAVIPGLQGQSAIANNYELTRLRQAAARPNVRYYAITADFEPERVGWKLWRVIAEFGDRAKDTTTDLIFPGENDLVVDTQHMISLADKRSIADVHAFAPSTNVHHCNYFRQPDTIAHLRTWLRVP